MMPLSAQEIERKALQEGGHKKAVEIAKALLNKGMDIDEISKVSGLCVDLIYGISQPYEHFDPFTKELFFHPERAGASLREHLPEKVVRFLSDKPAESIPISFLGERSREYLSDRLFRMETTSRQTILILVLLEHKIMPEQMVRGESFAWTYDIRDYWEKESPDWNHQPAAIMHFFFHNAERKDPDEFLTNVDTEKAWSSLLIDFELYMLGLISSL